MVLFAKLYIKKAWVLSQALYFGYR